jgi:hypothetical protein
MPSQDTSNLINILPPEILAHIFHQLVLTTPNFVPALSFRNESPYQITRLSHVCELWRSTALMFPELWATIHDHNMSAFEVYLQRSKSASLTIYISTNPMESLSTIAPHASRIYELHIEPESYIPLYMVLSKLCSSLPAMTCLTFNKPSTEVRNNQGQEPRIFIDAPLLCRLTTNTWVDVPRSSLTHFSLTLSRLDVIPTMEDFISFLRFSPLLQELILADLIPQSGDSHTTFSPVTLAHLSNICFLSLGPQNISRVLVHLKLAPHTSIEVWEAWWDFHIDETTDISSMLSENTSFLPSLGFMDRVQCTHLDQETITLQATSLVHTELYLSVQGPISERTDISWESLSASYVRTLKRLHHVLPVHTVRELWIGETDFDSHLRDLPSLWPTFLEKMPALEVLVVVSMSCEELFTALLEVQPLLCPKLRTLHILNISDCFDWNSPILSKAIHRRFVEGSPLSRVLITTRFEEHHILDALQACL